MRVIDLMTAEVVTVHPDTPLKEAARRMVRSRVSGLPVTDEDGTLVGIISEGDFLHREVARERPRRHGLLDALLGGQHSLAEAELVGEAMTEMVVTIAPDATLAEAARVMANHDVKRLPVVDTEGQVLGVLSRADIVAAFTRPDEIIEDEIREDVIRRVLFVDPDDLEVKVDDGVVTLDGELSTRTEARLLEELVRRLDGVVNVLNRVRWQLDDTKLQQRPGPFLAQ